MKTSNKEINELADRWYQKYCSDELYIEDFEWIIEQFVKTAINKFLKKDKMLEMYNDISTPNDPNPSFFLTVKDYQTITNDLKAYLIELSKEFVRKTYIIAYEEARKEDII